MIRHGASSQPTIRGTHWTQTTSSLRQKKNEEQKVNELDIKTTQPPTSELVVALNALRRAEEPPPPQTVNELMDHSLKDYQEECVEKGTFQSDPATDVGEWEEQDLGQMEANLNDLLYQACPFHPHQFIHCVNPQTEFGKLRYKCPQEGCPVYLFEDTRDIILEKLKVDTHPQVRAQFQRGLLEVQMRAYPQDEVESHHQELQQSLFELWELSPRTRTLWLFSMAPWPAVVSLRASATVSETMKHPMGMCPITMIPSPF